MPTQSANLLLAFAMTDLVACLMPGPAVMAVASIALTGSLRGVAGAIAGINISNILWYVMVGAGLTALVRAAPEVFVALRWAGIAYLFWLGITTWRSHAHLAVSREKARPGFRRGFTSALAIQLSNPKALVFFTVFLPPFINIRYPIAAQIAVLALIGIALEILTLGGYALLAYRLGRLAMSPRWEARIAHISGAIMIAVAAGLALSHTA